ncbi:MAG TPA: glycosyltransferase [Candidatus Binatia bacterium]|nr:glycosyltransferase [Candidatus Binatia bacterium]
MKKILFISGSIGLGHIFRDLAIARELRRLHPGIEIQWLAAGPAAQELKNAGEELLPEAEDLANENLAAETSAPVEGFHLNLLKYLLSARSGWKQNVEVFKQVMAKRKFDLIVGDETYEISIAIKENPAIKQAPYAVIYDFVGMEALTHNPVERLGVYIWNRIWAKGYKNPSKIIDAYLFVGEAEDIPDSKLGFLLPGRREWARIRGLQYLGYILPFDPQKFHDRQALRQRLGYGREPLVVGALGGTAIGRELLELCGRAFLLAREEIPGLHMVLVCGPRLDPATVHVPEGIDVKGYIQNLHEHFAASDLAIVQGGGTTTLELTALRRPFLYFPLEGHFEQTRYVAGRLARHQAGKRMDFSRTSPEALAREIASHIGQPVSWPPIAIDGARKAAQILKGYLQ